MALTKSDTTKMRYNQLRREGLSHKKAIQQWPEDAQEKVLADLKKSQIESHFGVKEPWFWIAIAASIISGIVMGLIKTLC